MDEASSFGGVGHLWALHATDNRTSPHRAFKPLVLPHFSLLMCAMQRESYRIIDPSGVLRLVTRTTSPLQLSFGSSYQKMSANTSLQIKLC